MAESQTYHSKSRKYAELLDSRFRIPGTEIKIGLDPIIGLVPGIGDWTGAAFSIYFMVYATRLGAGTGLLIRMFVNILVDLVIGAIPLLGDLFDIGWKANLRNAELLQKLEENPRKTEAQSKGLMWGLLALMVVILIAVLIVIGWLLGEVFEAIAQIF